VTDRPMFNQEERAANRAAFRAATFGENPSHPPEMLALSAEAAEAAVGMPIPEPVKREEQMAAFAATTGQRNFAPTAPALSHAVASPGVTPG
jgi:hypothetical protein